MHNAPLYFLIYLLYFKNSYLLNRSQLDPYVYDVFDLESALELNPEVVTLTPGTSSVCIYTYPHTLAKYEIMLQLLFLFSFYFSSAIQNYNFACCFI